MSVPELIADAHAWLDKMDAPPCPFADRADALALRVQWLGLRAQYEAKALSSRLRAGVEMIDS